MNNIIISMLVGFVMLIAIYHEWNGMKQQINEQEKRITMLEEAKRLRMPQEAMEKILNGMAALDALKQEKKFENDFIENAQSWFAQALATGTKREEK